MAERVPWGAGMAGAAPAPQRCHDCPPLAGRREAVGAAPNQTTQTPPQPQKWGRRPSRTPGRGRRTRDPPGEEQRPPLPAREQRSVQQRRSPNPLLCLWAQIAGKEKNRQLSRFMHISKRSCRAIYKGSHRNSLSAHSPGNIRAEELNPTKSACASPVQPTSNSSSPRHPLQTRHLFT